MPRIRRPKPLFRDDFPSDEAFEAALFSGWHEYAVRYFNESEVKHLMVLLEKEEVEYWSFLITEICTAGWELETWSVDHGDWYGTFRVNFRNRGSHSRSVATTSRHVEALRAKAEQVVAERAKAVDTATPTDTTEVTPTQA